MKALVGAFNQEKALVGAFSVIVQPVVEPMDRFTALPVTPASCLVSNYDPRWHVNTVHWAQLINTKYIRRINIINDPCESEQILPPQLGFC